MDRRSPNYQVRALERALDLLDAFSIAESELAFSDLAARVDLPKSTTFRLLAILEERGYVERSPETERYRIGLRAFEIGSIYLQTMRLEREAQPFLRRLAQECNQTANLAVLDAGEIVHIAVVPPNRPIRFYATIGQRDSAHCSGLGKSLLADLEDDDLAAVVARRGLARRTDRTIDTIEALRAHLAQVRAQGFAIDEEESVPGLTCVAAPIRDARDVTVASVSISGPSAEFGEAGLPVYITAVGAAARLISERLGNGIHAVGSRGFAPEELSG
jgi:IclR family KDG regulon transcriptional repressor